MLIISRQDRERLGLARVLDDCYCRSPQGRRLKAKHLFYLPQDKDLLEKEFSAIENLIAYSNNMPSVVRNTQVLLSHFRDLRETVLGLGKRRLLDIAELFEIKQAISLLKKLSKDVALLEQADVVITPLVEAERLLDPGNRGTSGFYLYDDYSPKLSEIRARRDRLEKQLAQAIGDQGTALLAERGDLVIQEDAEEAVVRRMLCDALLPYERALSDNLDAVGQLDFRLARAELAIAWNATRPVISSPGEATVLEQFRHPVIAAQLALRESAYERQTIAISKGTTVLTGPNMGGKSVALKALTLSLVLIQLGYFPPADKAETPLFDFISYSSDHLDTTRIGLSSFGAEIVRLRDDVARAKSARGLVVTDEPFRGTNPEQATALIGALCGFYAGLMGSFVVATHYQTPVGDNIKHVRIRGILSNALAEIMDKQVASSKSETIPTDEEAIRRIESLMDYSLETVDGAAPVPQGAIRIARWLGMDEDVLKLLEIQEDGCAHDVSLSAETDD